MPSLSMYAAEDGVVGIVVGDGVLMEKPRQQQHPRRHRLPTVFRAESSRNHLPILMSKHSTAMTTEKTSIVALVNSLLPEVAVVGKI